MVQVSKESYKIQMDIACEQLAKVIRNEKVVKNYKDAWYRMSLTSSQKKGGKKW